jgi:hypothetical protein
VVIVLAALAVALLGTAGLAAAAGGTAIGSAVPGEPAHPVETPTEAPSGTPAEPPGDCAECSCPVVTSPAPVPTTIENAAGRLAGTGRVRLVAAAPVETPVEYTFTVKTDKDGKIIALDRDKDVKAKPAHMRDDINGEVAEDDPHGCYQLRFDSRTVLRCTAASGTVNGAPITVVIQTKRLEDGNGGLFNRFFLNFNPRVKDATITIAVTCVGLN